MRAGMIDLVSPITKQNKIKISAGSDENIKFLTLSRGSLSIEAIVNVFTSAASSKTRPCSIYLASEFKFGMSMRDYTRMFSIT